MEARMSVMQFRLRTLFIVTILASICVCAFWYSIESQLRSQAERKAFRNFQECTEVEFTHHSTIVRIKPDAEISADKWRLLKTFEWIRYYDDFTDKLSFDLSNTDFSDAELRHLEGMTELVRVDFSGSKVTKEGVQHFREAMPGCEVLF